MWERWLPAAHRDRGPRVERRGVAGMRHVGGGHYEQVFADDAPEQADCWVYEDLVYVHKRHVAAVGYSRDEMTMTPMTYDEMRPGCYDARARVEDMELNHVEASLCFPTFPRFCGQTFSEGRGQGPRARLRAGVQRLDGRGVVRRRRRPADPADASCRCGTRSSPPPRSAATRRGACTRCASREIPPHLGLPSIHSGTGTRSSPPARRRSTTINMHIGSSSRRCRPPRPTPRPAWPPRSASTTPWRR